jgi:uncharacterized membrane protein YgcG
VGGWGAGLAVAGKGPRISRRDRKAIERAVDEAENTTGLQLCVYLGPAEGDSRAAAENLFVRAGLHERPAVLVLVAPAERRVEVVTSPEARQRIPDDAAAKAVETMTSRFAAGELAGGIVGGVQQLAQLAGPGTAPVDQQELPDVLDH